MPSGQWGNIARTTPPVSDAREGHYFEDMQDGSCGLVLSHDSWSLDQLCSLLIILVMDDAADPLRRSSVRQMVSRVRSGRVPYFEWRMIDQDDRGPMGIEVSADPSRGPLMSWYLTLMEKHEIEQKHGNGEDTGDILDCCCLLFGRRIETNLNCK
ncbi:hypothetical protein HAX54_012757 [Datura stramonium]|uniref:Uncharacterized protein n=1 Tax=Datura stramonium TaxID=4076 RepID=A0ABS8RXV5_DATST|nr:hypothetical protein [Datura stramonium]